MPEVRDVFVRAHTEVLRKKRPDQPKVEKWPDLALLVDTETTLDTAQKLTLGVYRICQLIGSEYLCIEEGLFYNESLNARKLKELKRYVSDPSHLPSVEVKKFPPSTRLKLMSRADFVERVFWKSIRSEAMVVGYNLPFDLSRLAVKSTESTKGGWSLVLSLRKSRETGELEPNPERPRVVIKPLDSKMAFISLGSILHREEWPAESRFLDLRALAWALRNQPYGLETACKAFGVPGKMNHKPSGEVNPEEIDYCREDVRATSDLLNALKTDFDLHPFGLRPDKAYSPASVAKAYLDEMAIAHPKEKFQVSPQELGIAMQSYFGGRAEVRIRKTPVPVVLTDFTSQYPTVNTLLENWKVLTAEKIEFEDCTEEIRNLLRNCTLEDAFNPSFWEKLSFFALVQPGNDIFPVRTVYNGRTQNIGLNYFSSNEPIWFAGPDLIASVLLTDTTPQILKAIKLVPIGKQSGMKTTNLTGIVPINPLRDDFFRFVIEQKSIHKPKNKLLANFFKVIANSGSYGLFVQVDQEKTRKSKNVKVLSGEISFERAYSTIEKGGPWYFPPLASLITAGGRLLLAMLEKCVSDQGGTYLFCDTDSLCIVSSKSGELVPCPGGPHKSRNKGDAVKALSWKQVKAIAERFNKLNPYNPALVSELLKIEDINFIGSGSSKVQRQLYGYAVSSKRYALYTLEGENITIIKASGHGLGFLYSPKDGFDQGADAPAWVMEAWDWLLRKELRIRTKEPSWLDLPAMMRVSLTSPNVLREVRPEWLSPFGFFFFPLISDLVGYPAGFDRTTFRFITPFSSNRADWSKLVGINLRDGQSYAMVTSTNGKQDKVIAETFRNVLANYLRRPEAKSLAPDGTACVADTAGLLKRAHVVAGQIIAVGKETDRHWEQGEDLSMVDYKVMEYRPLGNLAVASQALLDEIAKRGMRELIRESGLSQHTIETVRNGTSVRVRTLERIKAALANQQKQARSDPRVVW
jgi:hypothetical protein